MIRYAEGNLFDASVDALVNTVNEVGVMGKGVALMFREKFPASSEDYMLAARRGRVRVGKVYVTEGDSLVGPRWLIHFPTKKHWRHPSRLEWIREGLRDLIRVIRDRGITSVALPPLGCGNGGLDWDVVRREIALAFDALSDVECIVYKPTAVYYNRRASGAEGLTISRALIAELIRRYSVPGLGCTNLEVQKLAWFIHRWIEVDGLDNPLQLKFEASRYGPYADRLRHLLAALDGSYLHCERRLSDAGPGDLIWFDDERRNEVDRYFSQPWAAPYHAPLMKTSELIDGFESPLGMELLATVDWLIVIERCEATVSGIRQGLARWPARGAAGRRKQALFGDEMLKMAINRLQESGLVGIRHGQELAT